MTDNSGLNIKAYVLVVLFGLSSWSLVNGIYTQVPLLINVLPEKNFIVTYMIVTFQLSNLAPLIHMFLSKFVVSKNNSFKFDTYSTLSIIILTIVILFGYIFFWRLTIPFLVLTFFAGVAASTSSVVYWPLISKYPAQYTSALSVGEGSTALVTGVLALIQQPGTPSQTFSFQLFCSFIMILLVVSAASFLYFRFFYGTKIIEGYTNFQNQEENEKISDDNNLPFFKKYFNTIRLSLFQGTISFFQNAVIVSILPFTFSPYPHSNTLLTLAITLSFIIDPICGFLAYKLNFYSFYLSAVWLVLGIFLFVIGILPQPPFQNSLVFGGFLVFVKVLCRALIAYVKTKEFLIGQQKTTKQNSKSKPTNFKVGGISIQIGSFIGAMLMLCLTLTGIVN